MASSDVVYSLCDRLTEPATARARPSGGGVPPEPGLYAWWGTRDALPQVPPQYVADADAWLLYVGIAPSRPGSRQTLRGRICGNHLRGNVGSSTLRLSLAALLWQQEQWPLSRRGNRPALAPAGNQALSTWQEEHLRVSWVVQGSPWEIEAAVVKALSPPLNLAMNRTHAYSWALSEARQRFRSAALSSDEFAGT